MSAIKESDRFRRFQVLTRAAENAHQLVQWAICNFGNGSPAEWMSRARRAALIDPALTKAIVVAGAPHCRDAIESLLLRLRFVERPCERFGNVHPRVCGVNDDRDNQTVSVRTPVVLVILGFRGIQIDHRRGHACSIVDVEGRTGPDGASRVCAASVQRRAAMASRSTTGWRATAACCVCVRDMPRWASGTVAKVKLESSDRSAPKTRCTSL
jgi:hypothetical protein